jgi:hypothetical protein
MKNREDKYFDSKSIMISTYTPAVFCAFISYMAMFLEKSAMPAFYSFLPMCFLFYAFTMHALIRKVRNLEKAIDDIKNKNASHTDSPNGLQP